MTITIDRPSSQLSERQKREREYYDSYCGVHDEAPVNFAPIEGKEKRPWNAYWHAYELAIEKYHAVVNQSGVPTLLDFGCGTGQTAITMAKLGYEVCGFDVSERQVEAATARAQTYEVAQRCDFSVQVAENLQYEDNTFDCVLGIDILHHIEIEESIRETYRVLKPGGVGIFREWIEVEAFDRLRESAAVQKFFPKGKSFAHHRTEDERKLNREDMAIIRNVFQATEARRFGVMSRLCRVLPHRDWIVITLERMDHAVFSVAPFCAALGGEVVLALRKEAA